MMEENREFTSEFKLALACARWPLLVEDQEEIRQYAKQDLDWDQFVRIIERNQIMRLAYRNLCAALPNLPNEGNPERIRRKIVGFASQCLSQAAELARISGAAKELGIDIVVLKGVVLSVLAYGQLALRSPGDIDLLVDPAKVLEFERVLLQLGYVRYEPKAHLTPRRLRHYLKYYKHFAYVNDRKGINIEVHWRLFHNNHLAEPEFLSKTVQVNIGPGTVSTLPPQELFLYLCVHGGIHGWPVLKWLADIGALLRGMSAEELRVIAALASERGLKPEFHAALMLVDSFLNVKPPDIDPSRADDPIVRRIVAMAHRLLTANNYCLAISDFPRIGMFRYGIGIGPSWRYRSEDIQRALVFPDDWDLVDLPDTLFPLYVAVRPVSWLMRNLTRVPKRLFGIVHSSAAQSP
jgi:hypothetical protein